MKHLIILVGPPGSGKSTLAKGYEPRFDNLYYRVNQDEQGKDGHLEEFKLRLANGENIIVDRMNFNKDQRARYLVPAKEAGYTTTIIVLHQNFETCMKRCLAREGHPTIKDQKDASRALNFFFQSYQRVSDDEADEVKRVWPEGYKRPAIVCDLDGTLCNIDHRLHFMKQPKKDWKNFFLGIKNDTVNSWCQNIIWAMRSSYAIIYASGRPDDHKKVTKDWLIANGMGSSHDVENLFMRRRGDRRQDDIVKEVILDFEILTEFRPLFAIDDRDQVVKMWRRRGITCLQCNYGDF